MRLNEKLLAALREIEALEPIFTEIRDNPNALCQWNEMGAGWRTSCSHRYRWMTKKSTCPECGRQIWKRKLPAESLNGRR